MQDPQSGSISAVIQKIIPKLFEFMNSLKIRLLSEFKKNQKKIVLHTHASLFLFFLIFIKNSFVFWCFYYIFLHLKKVLQIFFMNDFFW